MLPFRPAQVESLHWKLCHVKDPRGGNKSIGIGPLLVIFTMAAAPASRKEGLLTAEWTGLWARYPLSDHQAGSAAKVSAKCRAGIV